MFNSCRWRVDILVFLVAVDNLDAMLVVSLGGLLAHGGEMAVHVKLVGEQATDMCLQVAIEDSLCRWARLMPWRQQRVRVGKRGDVGLVDFWNGRDDQITR